MNTTAPAIRTYRWAVTIVAALLLALALVQRASADPQEITITPTTATPYIVPGKTFTGSLQVLDQGTTGYDYSVYTTPYHVSGENYTPDFTMLPNAPKVDSWFHLSTAGGHVKPGRIIAVQYRIAVPAHTPPGGYYAAIFAEATPPKGQSLTLSERVGELFYIQVAGPVTQHGALLTWQSNTFQTPPLTAVIRIQDSGNLHFASNIHYEADDVLGHPKYSLTTTKELLPQSIRRIAIPWNDAPPLGLFKVKGSVSFLGQTHTLPAKWVLVMSATTRVVIAGIFICLFAFFLGRGAYQIKAKHRKQDKES